MRNAGSQTTCGLVSDDAQPGLDSECACNHLVFTSIWIQETDVREFADLS